MSNLQTESITPSTRVTDIVPYVTDAKCKWAGLIAGMYNNSWTIRTTEWQ